MFGAHLSISGGLHNALLSAERLGMETVQIFTKNQQQWRVPPLSDEAIEDWRSHARRMKFKRTVAHASYLINLAAADAEIWRKSVELFVEEIRRCHLLGVPYLVVHPGAHVGAGEAAGLTKIVAALDVIHQQIPEASKTVATCLEITAGQGSCLGCTFEHLATIMDRVKHSKRLGVCLDTAHLWAAGYDFRGRKYAKFRKQIESTVGVSAIKVWHLNDSKKELGSRVDRHDHIGLGKIGLEGFKAIVRDETFKNVPKIFELPPGESDDGRLWEERDLAALRSLLV
ncbi:deoxyribonuclease IV [soil metagenome]